MMAPLDYFSCKSLNTFLIVDVKFLSANLNMWFVSRSISIT
jgi:hypothetical protein